MSSPFTKTKAVKWASAMHIVYAPGRPLTGRSDTIGFFAEKILGQCS